MIPLNGIGACSRRVPETVADVQVQFAIGELRRGREHVFKLAKLADDPAYAQVANPRESATAARLPDSLQAETT